MMIEEHLCKFLHKYAQLKTKDIVVKAKLKFEI